MDALDGVRPCGPSLVDTSKLFESIAVRDAGLRGRCDALEAAWQQFGGPPESPAALKRVLAIAGVDLGKGYAIDTAWGHLKGGGGATLLRNPRCLVPFAYANEASGPLFESHMTPRTGYDGMGTWQLRAVPVLPGAGGAVWTHDAAVPLDLLAAVGRSVGDVKHHLRDSYERDVILEPLYDIVSTAVEGNALVGEGLAAYVRDGYGLYESPPDMPDIGTVQDAVQALLLHHFDNPAPVQGQRPPSAAAVAPAAVEAPRPAAAQQPAAAAVGALGPPPAGQQAAHQRSGIAVAVQLPASEPALEAEQPPAAAAAGQRPAAAATAAVPAPVASTTEHTCQEGSVDLEQTSEPSGCSERSRPSREWLQQYLQEVGVLRMVDNPWDLMALRVASLIDPDRFPIAANMKGIYLIPLHLAEVMDASYVSESGADGGNGSDNGSDDGSSDGSGAAAAGGGAAGDCATADDGQAAAAPDSWPATTLARWAHAIIAYAQSQPLSDAQRSVIMTSLAQQADHILTSSTAAAAPPGGAQPAGSPAAAGAAAAADVQPHAPLKRDEGLPSGRDRHRSAQIQAVDSFLKRQLAHTFDSRLQAAALQAGRQEAVLRQQAAALQRLVTHGRWREASELVQKIGDALRDILRAENAPAFEAAAQPDAKRMRAG